MSETEVVWACPKDGAAMEPMGRRGRGGVRRCPTCRGVFLDMEAMRRGRRAQPPAWMPFVMSVVMSVAVTVLIRRLRRHPRKPQLAPGVDAA